MSLKGQIVSGVKWTTVSTIVNAATSILKISILTRYLDKSDFGLMAIMTMAIGFMDLFTDMGLSSAILHKQNISKKEYASLYWLNIFASIIIYGLLVLISPFISKFYHEIRLATLLPLVGLNLLLSAIGRQFKTMQSKDLLFKEIALIDTVTSVLSLAVSIFFATLNYGILSLVYSVLFQYLVSNLCFFAIGIRKFGLLIHFRLQETTSFLSIGGYQVGGQVLNYFNRDLDILIIGKVFPSEILGAYSLAKQLVFRPAQIINPVLTRVAAPTLSQFQSNMEVLKINYLKLLNIISLLNIFIYVLMIILAPWIVTIFYGSGFQNIISLVRILSIYMIIRAIGNPVGSLVVATGKTRLEFIWNLVTIIIIPFFIIIGSKFDINGVAVAITLSSVILFVPFWKLLINKMTGASLTEYLMAIIDIRIIRNYIQKLWSNKMNGSQQKKFYSK